METKVELSIFDENNLDYESKCVAAWLLQTLVHLRLWKPYGDDYVVNWLNTHETASVIEIMEWHVKEYR